MNKSKSMIVTILTVSSLFLLCGFTAFRGETGNDGANVTEAKTPINPERGGTIWTRSFSSFDGMTAMNSDPILSEDSIFIVSKNTLYALDYKGEIQKQMTLAGTMNSICHLLYEDHYLYIPLAKGIVECVDTKNFTEVWVSESPEGQSGSQALSTLFYHNGYVYGGTVTVITNSPPTSTGVFYCLNAATGKEVWTYENTENAGGYYWSGGIVHGNAIYFTGENGILVSHSLTTEEVYDTYTLTDSAQIRAGITYDSTNDSLYTVSNDGTIFKIKVEQNGIIASVESAKLAAAISKSEKSEIKFVNCTSTPTIYNNRLYIGCSADTYGYLTVLDADTLNGLYAAKTAQYAEVKASPLVSKNYATEENNNKVYVYFTCNCNPGGIYLMEDSEKAESAVVKTLFEPAKAKQFCLSSVTAGADGTLYYSNDSGTLFAVADVDVSSDRIADESDEMGNNSGSQSDNTENKSTSAGSSTPNNNAANSTEQEVSKPKKPTGIKIKKKKKKIVITWKKKTKKSQTVVYVKYGKRAWKKKLVKTKTKLSIKRKKKTKIRLRSRIYKNKKWIYSKYTKIYTIR